MKTKWTLPMGITINRHLHDGWDLCVNIRVLGHGSVLTYRVTGYENLYSFKPYNESKLILIMFETEASGQIQYEDVLFPASCQ